MNDWQPTSSHDSRIARANLLRSIRHFFYTRDVLEVETPLLSSGTVTDEHLDAFLTKFNHSRDGAPVDLYLQTSPEFAMKRLLCGQSGAIYQICKAFRHEGEGRWHNPEFTMLEWYRPGFNHHALMQEVDALLIETLGTDAGEIISYQDVFKFRLGIDPLTATDEMLLAKMADCNIDISSPEQLDKDSKLQLLFAMEIEPVIGQERPCFVFGFPASQASLARINTQDSRTADRFEVYFKGAELANGFHELSDASEQQLRFEQDNEKRRKNGQPVKPIDTRFLSALKSGLPQCAGVALGVDRLLMLKIGASHIQEVLNFPVSKA